MRMEKPVVVSSEKKGCLMFKGCIKCRLLKTVSLLRVENNFGVLCHKTNQNVRGIYISLYMTISIYLSMSMYVWPYICSFIYLSIYMSRKYTSEKEKIEMLSKGYFFPVSQ